MNADFKRDRASKGGEAKQAKRVAALGVLVAQLPPLDSPENCMASLQQIRDLSLSGMVTGSQAGSAVRACEAWLKAHAMEIDLSRIRALEEQVTVLEEALRKARAGALRAS